MEFSSDYTSFQLKSVNNNVMDFSTDYASLTLRRKRSGSVLLKGQKNNSNTTTFMVRRLAWLLGVVVIMLLAIVLPKMLHKIRIVTCTELTILQWLS